MKPSRRQFVSALAVAPFVPVPEVKPWWYVDPSDPIFDTQVFSSGVAWCPIMDLTKKCPRYMGQPPDWIPGPPVEVGPFIALRDLSLEDRRMRLDRVIHALGSTLREFALWTSGSERIKHARHFSDGVDQEHHNLAFAIASRHWDAGEDVGDYVCSFHYNHSFEPDERDVRLGDLLDLWSGALNASTDAEQSRVRNRVFDSLVVGDRFRVFDLTRPVEEGGHLEELTEQIDNSDMQRFVNLGGAALYIQQHGSWQEGHQFEHGSRAAFALLGDNIAVVIPWSGERIASLYSKRSHTPDDLLLFEQHLKDYREEVDSLAIVVDHDYKVCNTEWLSKDDYESLQEQIDWARTDPDFQIFLNYEIECEDPVLQARIHIFDGASADELAAERARHPHSCV